ncbi:enoyl-CoA hydratase/isomerase family protein [Novosphingobium sp. G106]|uniref:enoyl-CoA hydratase/isomerase family protein n=1 Tax=Novosphingobium sp. G106 TaxID=2849500 RepID=UPI001C2DCD48|nr:enoyl-CoA hydratase-related protein [Novosphingobium sp. G106]MBV1688871.1 enoyl-CoA hydratase/isomerase family protein [Novosphingobium sp. G106]
MYENYESLKFERRGKVLTITMDNPPMNSASVSLHTELSYVFYDVARDPECSVVVLTGEGRAFSAGGDINLMLERAEDPHWQSKYFRRGNFIIHSMLGLEKPIIARINGHAMGLGATVALLCDLTVASEKAKIADPHVAMGLSAGDGGAFIWPQMVGFARAKWFLLTGEHLTASEAVEIGLINKCVPPEQLDEVVYALADKLANGPTHALNATKRSVNMLLRRQVEGVIEAHLGLEMLTVFTEDHKEAARAFLAKETPVFKGC